MTEEQIIQTALENFQIATNIQTHWNKDGIEQFFEKREYK